MRGKTRNLLENMAAFIIFVLIVLVIVAFILKYTGVTQGFDLDINLKDKIAKKIQDYDRQIKEKILKKDEKEEDIQKDINNTQKEEKIINILPKKEEPKVEKKEQKKKIIETKKEEQKVVVKKVEKTTQSHEVKVKKEEKTLKKEINTKKTEKKKPILSMENLEKFRTIKKVINKFLRTTREKVTKEVANLNIPKTENQRYANIRITVLKDGSYEHLKLMDGDKEYFELVTPAILSVFPVEIDPRIDDQFPRYFRMKIKE